MEFIFGLDLLNQKVQNCTKLYKNEPKIFLDMLIQISLNTQEHLWQGALSVSEVLDALRGRAPIAKEHLWQGALNVSKVLDALRERALIAKEHYTF